MKLFYALFAALFIGASQVQGQVCADFCFDPCDTCVPCNPCETYVYNPCLFDLDDCSLNDCGDGPNRFYLGPIYYYRRTDFILNECTQSNIFGLNGTGRAKGQFVGVNFGYEYRDICCWYMRVDGLWSTGTERPCPRSRVNDWAGEGRIGYTWGECVPAGYGVTPYFGLGYIWQNRRFGHLHFKADYQTWYAPLGIYADVEIMCGFTAGVDVTFAPFFSSKIKAVHREFDFSKNHESRNRYMWRVSLPLRYQVMCSCGFELSVEPFWEQMNFGRICNVRDPNHRNHDDDDHHHDRDEHVLRPGLPQFRENLWGAKFLAAYRF